MGKRERSPRMQERARPSLIRALKIKARRMPPARLLQPPFLSRPIVPPLASRSTPTRAGSFIRQRLHLPRFLSHVVRNVSRIRPRERAHSLPIDIRFPFFRMSNILDSLISDGAQPATNDRLIGVMAAGSMPTSANILKRMLIILFK